MLTQKSLDMAASFCCCPSNAHWAASSLSPRLSLLDPDEEAIGHMLLSLRCNLRERRPEWRGGVISWQRLLSALSPWGEKCSTLLPSFSQKERCWRSKWKNKANGKEEKEEVSSVGTLLLPSPLLLADELSDTTNYSSHYSQCLTSECVRVCVCTCVYEWPHIHS